MKWFNTNKHKLFFFLIGLIIGLFVESLKVKDTVIPVSNDELAIVTLDNIIITSNDYYEKLKDESDISSLLDIIDNKLLEEKYPLNKEELNNIKKEMQEIIKNYNDYYSTTKEQFLKDNNFKTEDAFYNYLVLEKRRELYEKDYLRKIIKDNDINYYYNNKLINDFEISYFKGSEKDLMNILSELNQGTKKEDVKKKYSKVTYKDLGYVSFDSEIDSDIYNDASNLEENTYSTSLRSINDEYYLIFKGNVKAKEDVKVLKDRIKEQIVLEKIENDQSNILYFQSLINLREENNIEFQDTTLKSLYQKYCKEIKNFKG